MRPRSCAGWPRSGASCCSTEPGTGLSDPVAGIPDRAAAGRRLPRRARCRRLAAGGGHRLLRSVRACDPARRDAPRARRGPDRDERHARALTPTDDFIPGTEHRFEPFWAMIRHSTDHWGDGAMLHALSPYARENLVYRRLAPNRRAGLRESRHGAGHDQGDVGLRRHGCARRGGRADAGGPPDRRRRSGRGLTLDCRATSPGPRCSNSLGPSTCAISTATTSSPASRTSSAAARPAGPSRASSSPSSTPTSSSRRRVRWKWVTSVGRRCWPRTTPQCATQVERHDGTLIKTMGDGVLATFDRPTLAVRCALAISRHAGEEGVQVRAGVHAGECEVTDDDISGVAAHIGSRIMALAGPAEVLVSATVRDLVFGSGVDFEARGEHELEGSTGQMGGARRRGRPPRGPAAGVPGHARAWRR